MPYERFVEGQVSGFLHKPEINAIACLVLTHGAGSNCQAPLLVAVADAFVAAGYFVLRCDLPFRQQRRFGPPHPAHASADRNGLRAAVTALKTLTSVPACLGGHSYGGRQASMLAAEENGLVERLLLLSYPLHPPGKPAQVRTAHFPSLTTPALFVHGDSDPFGTVAEIQAAISQLPGPNRLIVIEGAGHDLQRGKFDVAGQVVAPFANL